MARTATKPALIMPTANEMAKHAPRQYLGSKYGIISKASDALKAATIQREIGNLDKIKLLSGRVLVALYIAGETYAGTSLYRTDTQTKEDLWQGSVGLVVKLGNLAFKDDVATNTYFHGQSVNVGDWVLFRPGDGKRCQINGVDCRIIEDALIDMVLDDPAAITHFS
jgi:co-chaperonin GroES (HSP10)